MEIKQPPKQEIHIPPKPRAALEDRKLLDRPARKDRLQSESWRIFRIQSEIVDGFEHLADVYPAVSIFGSARTVLSNQYYTAAAKTAELLGKAGFAIISGGGPGIMEAANRGAREAGALSSVRMLARVAASGRATDHLRCLPRPALNATSDNRLTSVLASEMFCSSKLGRTSPSGNVMVAARRIPKASRRLRSRCTTLALPLSIPSAAGGKCGLMSLLKTIVLSFEL